MLSLRYKRWYKAWHNTRHDMKLHYLLSHLCVILTQPDIFFLISKLSLSALIACNAMNWPGGLHHWLMLYTLGLYIVNVQWSRTSKKYLTTLTLPKFGGNFNIEPLIFRFNALPDNPQSFHREFLFSNSRHFHGLLVLPDWSDWANLAKNT